MQACGAKYHNKKELLDETDVDDVVVALVNLARRVSHFRYASYLQFIVQNFCSNPKVRIGISEL